ncbi:MAG: sigma-70 family RNA polymerase sigma factor [bacterium]
MNAPSMSTTLDADVAAAANGDRAAFARLVSATSGVVCAIGLAILRDVSESQDVAQDVFVAAWTDLGKLRNPSSFLPWIRQLARNRAHHVLRTTRRRERRVVLPESGGASSSPTVDERADTLLAAAADAAPSALERIIADEERALLHTVLSELPNTAREVVILYYREGSSVHQVAELLGLSEAAVKQRLARARAQVREALLQRGGDVLRSSAPSAAFIATVVAAVGVSVSPSVAAAAGVGAGVGTGALSASLRPAVMQKARTLGAASFGAAGTAALAGLFGGLTSVFGGSKRLLRLARTDAERRGIVRIRAAMTMAVTQFSLAMLFYPRNGAVVTTSYVVFITVLGLAQLVWIPSITASRKAAEVREGISSDRAQLRSRRRTQRVFLAAVAIASIPIVAAWFLRW